MAGKNKQKLELTWIGKDERPRLEPRILLEDKERSYHAAHRVSEDDIFDNVLIRGDNLLALKALEQEYSGEVKCIYIDPPYNTGSAFEHYDDGVEHSLWLSLMRDRLEILKRLLREDGSIWISIDDTEGHYLKVLADEVFGRANFVTNVIWEKADSPRMDARLFSSRHDHILVFCKNIEKLELHRLAGDDAALPKQYSKTDQSGRPYYLKPLRAMGAEGTRAARPSMYFPIPAPDGTLIYPKNPDGSDSRWRWSAERVQRDIELIEWVEGRNGWSANYRVYADNANLRPPETIWPHLEVGSNRTSKAEVKVFNEQDVFTTPKPEKLLRRIIQLASSEDDLVLDSFGGSGTTAAVAHKMKRRWIMVELGEHCYTHIIPRLKKVIDGEDRGGITKAVDWNGGGGFRFYELAPSLLKKDKWDNYIINPEYNAEMLAEALCKLHGFNYEPSDSIYWMQGHSTESDFIYVTTQSLSREQLQAISDEVGEERTLLICCKAFRSGATEFPNLTVKKIPNSVLNRCEWDKDDYSLQVENLKMKEPDPGTQQGLSFED